MKMAMPDGAVMGVCVQGAQTGATTSYDGRIVEVSNPQHIKALRDLGAFPANLAGGRSRGGYRCDGCGFGSFFRHCGRCGGTCTKET